MNILTKKLLQPLQKQIQINKLQSLTPQYGFSDFWKNKDLKDIKNYDEELNMHPYYRNIRRKWMIPLEKKKLRKERVQELRQQTPEKLPEDEKFVVHNPVVGIEYPPKDDQIYAVLELLGKQYKVMQDDLLISDYIENYNINDSVVFDSVLLVGTPHYTSVGRPYVGTAKVYATVEEQTYSEKTIVFKYKRRARAKKSIGSRVPLTVLRIDKIEHVLDEQLNRATSLI